ncbi:MAG: hypothetical protein R3C69_16145 [Geminicoccaceae bacterium]
MAHMGHPGSRSALPSSGAAQRLCRDLGDLLPALAVLANVMLAIEEYQVADKVFFGSDFPFSTPGEGIELTRAVREIGGSGGMPRVAGRRSSGSSRATPTGTGGTAGRTRHGRAAEA